MELSPQVIEGILQADSKAFATSGKHGINVVPVSTIRIVDDKILLMNYFLGKTLDNIAENPHIALSCWKGLGGYQIKGTALYIVGGDVFKESKEWIEKNVSNRTLKGLIIITPENVYDVSLKV